MDNGDLSGRNLITGIVFDDLNCTDAVSEFAKRQVIVHERAVSGLYSQRILTSYGLNCLIRVSALHCHSPEYIETFLQITRDIIAESRTVARQIFQLWAMSHLLRDLKSHHRRGPVVPVTF